MEARAKVVMTDSKDAQTRLCADALERAGVKVTLSEKTVRACCKLFWMNSRMPVCWMPLCPGWMRLV